MSISVRITDDYDLEKIASSGQCFRWEKIAKDGYRILHGKRCVYVESLQEQWYSFSCDEKEFAAVWTDYFDFQENYAGIRSRIDKGEDPFLWLAAEHERGIRILRQEPWEILVTFIISQNKNIPAIRRSEEMLSKLCGERRTDSREREYYAFPTPEAITKCSEQELRACSLGYRWKYVLEVALAVKNGYLDLNLLRDKEEEQTTKALMSLYGVGMKVASCVSLFGLHHMDAFPKDVWIKRILANEYPNGYPFTKYSPYNGVYQQYMFAYYRKKERKEP